MLGVLEAEGVGDLGDGLIGAAEVLLRLVDELQADVLLGGLAGLFLDEVAEIAGGEAGFVGEVLHGGETGGGEGRSVVQVTVHLALELLHHVVVDLGAGVELTVVCTTCAA